MKLLEETKKRFTLTERLIFYVCFGILLASSLTLLWRLNTHFLVEVPAHGGTLTEGIVGSPRFINPLLAISDADRDMTALVYSGLLKPTLDGTLVGDLAKTYSVSEDGLTYTFILKDKIFFHDNTPVTADDVVFTIQKAQDPALKSPKRANWEGVEVKKVSDTEVQLILKQSYAPFLQNATMGILPKHIWKDTSADEFPFSLVNIEPIGSGPFKVGSVKKGTSGAPNLYSLNAFKKYADGQPFLSQIVLRFYTNETNLLAALKAGQIESVNSISPTEAEKLEKAGERIEGVPLPRIFGVFFNQNEAPVLANKEVRLALDRALPKQAIVDTVLHGYGTTIDNPIPPGIIREETLSAPDGSETPEERIVAARKILENAGWKMGTSTNMMTRTVKKEITKLSFSLVTSNAPELKESAELMKKAWEKLGAEVDLKIFESGDLNQNVIRPRKYGALLFGEIVGRDLDLFAFWHSSQRNDPGLNISLYTNIKADKLLEEARKEIDAEKRLEKYKLFEDEVRKDVPAVFIYSPDFLYALPRKIQGVSLNHLTVPSERFIGANLWYIKTEHVWEFLAPENVPNIF
jgi:peptide/nickel transport system substrate-binding protein